MQTYCIQWYWVLVVLVPSFTASIKAITDISLHCLCLSSQQCLVARGLVNFKRFHLNGRCYFKLLAIFEKRWAGKHRTFVLLFYIIEINKKTKLGPQRSSSLSSLACLVHISLQTKPLLVVDNWRFTLHTYYSTCRHPVMWMQCWN